MSNNPVEVTDYEVLEMMETYGGSFVKEFSRACHAADPINYRILKTAFPKIWEEYTNIAIIHKSNKKS